jgi:hypothetical protein
MNGAEPGKPTCCPRGPKSTTVNLFRVDPSWYERYWWSDSAPRRRGAFGYFHRILSHCPNGGFIVGRRWSLWTPRNGGYGNHPLEGLGGELDK